MMRPGFTLIELLLVIALVSLLGAGVSAFGSRMLNSNAVDNTQNELVHLLNTAQLNTLAGKADTAWGVTVDSGQMTAFAGSSYASRESSLDIVFSLPSNVSVSNYEVVFTPISGETDAETTFSITAVGDSAQVTVSQLGVISSQ